MKWTANPDNYILEKDKGLFSSNQQNQIQVGWFDFSFDADQFRSAPKKISDAHRHCGEEQRRA
jgi:hypothetical protein